MNKDEKSIKTRLKTLWQGRIKEIALLGGLALVLLFAAWKIFQSDGDKETAQLQLSDTEIKVVRLLEKIDGVGAADVIVCEGDGEVKSVVVVCEGAKDLRVIMNVREAVAAALDTEQKSVKIYLKKEK